MNTQQAYIKGFLKRAAEYNINKYEAINILKAASDYKTNSSINAEIQTQNANFGKPAGSMGLIDFPIKGNLNPRRPVYNPTNIENRFPIGATVSQIPFVGNIAGPVMRAAEGDLLGAGINLGSSAALGLGAPGIVPSKVLELVNDARDVTKLINRKADAYNKFEKQNRPVQG